MPKVMEFKIEQLQPTQEKLSHEVLEDISKGTNRKGGILEVWDIGNGIYAIAEGHHHTRYIFEQGVYVARGILHNRKNTLISPPAYDYFIEELKKFTTECRQKGITHISHLKVS